MNIQIVSITMVVIVVTSFGLFVSSAHSATDCSLLPGTRPAIDTDAAVQNGQIKAGTCYNPNDTTIGQTGEQAKQYLKSLPCSSGNCDFGPNFNDSYAICAKRFFEEYQKKYGTVTIRSAYRSSAYDAKMCVNNPACGALANNPNPNGNHQRGLAIDVASANQQTLWDFARNNPQFGVCFPFTGEGGTFRDTVHMILAGGPGSEGRGPGCRGVTKACDGSNFDPSSIKDATPGQSSSPSSQAPMASLGQALRNYLSPQPQAAAPVSTIGSAQACVQYYPVSTPSSDPCAYYVPPTASSTSININTNVNVATSSAAMDLIDALANPTSTRPVTTGTPIALNDGAAVTLAGQTTNPDAPTSTYTQSPTGPQTFTSQDLSQTPSQGSSSSTFAWQILESLKQMLLKALSSLKPFGGSPASSQTAYIY